MSIVAVVVTCSRIELPKRTVRYLQQNKPVPSIVVINSGGTDATAEWLKTQPGLIVTSQTSVGGSGGFYTDMQYAYQAGADWIWCTDGDVFPRADCLEQLLLHADREDIGILTSRRLQEGKLFACELRGYNLVNLFASMYTGKLSKRTVAEPMEIQGAAFEGPFVRRGVVEKIGYSNKELFASCGDADYCLRTVQAGFEILYTSTTLMGKEKFFSNDSWNGRNKKKKWERFYQVHNSTCLSHRCGHNWAVRYLRDFNGMAGRILAVLLTCPFTDAYQWSDIVKLWKAYCDRIYEWLGKT